MRVQKSHRIVNTTLLAGALLTLASTPFAQEDAKPTEADSYRIVTVELPRHADRFTPERAWSEYGDMLIQAIVYPAPLALESR